MSNYNEKTGIRYGVISARSLNQDLFCELLYTHGTNETLKEAEEDHKKQARKDAQIFDDIDLAEFEENYECPDFDIDEPTYSGSYKGVEYAVTYLGGAQILWVFESPNTGCFDLCSPCVPGACNLDSPNPEGYLGYDVPADWREEG